MATTAYTIRSHYDPDEKELWEFDSGQIGAEQALEMEEERRREEWRAESSSAFPRRLPPPPRFVPATMPYDPWMSSTAVSSSTQASEQDGKDVNEVASWYRSLKRETPASSSAGPSTPGALSPKPPINTSSAPASPKPGPRQITKSKSNWFIHKSLADSSLSEPPSRAPSTLADILARDPPPRRSETSFKPPVFLHIGPSNRGFSMLQKSGWHEGEALGPDVVRRRRTSTSEPLSRGNQSKGKEKERVASTFVEDGDGMVEVVDLVSSDSEDDEAEDSLEDEPLSSEAPSSTQSPAPEGDTSDPNPRKALLTPITTVLKSDRLGIGLKAKTVGPYKASQKRVTHSSSTLAAHIRTNKQAQLQKLKYGRGHRGLERKHKRENEKRRTMIAYLNS